MRDLERTFLNGVVLGVSLIGGTCIGKAVTNITDSKSIGIASGISAGTIMCSVGGIAINNSIDKIEDRELVNVIEKNMKIYSNMKCSGSEYNLRSSRILSDIEKINDASLRKEYQTRLFLLDIEKRKELLNK